MFKFAPVQRNSFTIQCISLPWGPVDNTKRTTNKMNHAT